MKVFTFKVYEVFIIKSKTSEDQVVLAQYLGDGAQYLKKSRSIFLLIG